MIHAVILLLAGEGGYFDKHGTPTPELLWLEQDLINAAAARDRGEITFLLTHVCIPLTLSSNHLNNPRTGHSGEIIHIQLNSLSDSNMLHVIIRSIILLCPLAIVLARSIFAVRMVKMVPLWG